MDAVAVLLVLAVIFLWGTVAARLERADLAAPIVFTVLGAGLAARYGRAEAARGPEPGGSVVDVAVRGLPRRRPGTPVRGGGTSARDR